MNSAAIIPIAGASEYLVTSARVGNFQFHPVVVVLVSQMWVR